MIFEEKMAKQKVAKNLREANILTFIMESIDFRHYRWETWMSIQTIVQDGSVHDHVQRLAGKWCPNPIPAPRILYLSLVSESLDFHFPVKGDRTATFYSRLLGKEFWNLEKYALFTGSSRP